MACASSRNRGCHGTEKIRWKLAAWGVLMVALSAAGDSDNLGRRIRANEDIVRTLQEAATELYATRGQVVPGCSCSVHACSNEFPPGRECSDKLGHSEEICGGCEEKGRMLDLLKSMVRTPPGEDPEKLSPEVIESICTFQPLDKDFVAKGPDGNYTWTYIGTTTGVHRVWPGLAIVRGLPDDDPEQPLGSCRKFDPRERPWFNAASSGPKDVVIVLDTSTSMGETLGSRGKTRPPEESVCQLQVLRGKESQCPDIIEQRPCFYMDSEKKYYTTVPENKLPFEEAAEACIKLGGHLAEPKSDVAHAFLSSLATREGCWIGLRLGNSPPFRWRWEVSEEEAEQIPRTDPEGSSFWASRAKGANECAAIDRRGRRKNVFDVSCKKEMAFVCEFEATKAPEQCSGNDTERVTEDFVSMVPSIDLCSDYESARLASTSVIDKTLGIVSETAVCPLGTPETSTEEVQCCSCKTAVPKSCGAGVDDPPCVDG
eukprot:evm.model.scf_1118.2 EVM.evm.TU.scf_1118.2   scf_1118:25257-37809(+)